MGQVPEYYDPYRGQPAEGYRGYVDPNMRPPRAPAVWANQQQYPLADTYRPPVYRAGVAQRPWQPVNGPFPGGEARAAGYAGQFGAPVHGMPASSGEWVGRSAYQSLLPASGSVRVTDGYIAEMLWTKQQSYQTLDKSNSGMEVFSWTQATKSNYLYGTSAQEVNEWVDAIAMYCSSRARCCTGYMCRVRRTTF